MGKGVYSFPEKKISWEGNIIIPTGSSPSGEGLWKSSSSYYPLGA